DAVSEFLAELRQIHPPIDAEHGCARSNKRTEQVIRGFRKENHGRIARGELFDQQLCCRKLKIAVCGCIQFASPGVEELHSTRPRGDLRLEIYGCRAGNFFEQFAEDTRLVPEHSFCSRKAVAGSALNKVAGKRP